MAKKKVAKKKTVKKALASKGEWPVFKVSTAKGKRAKATKKPVGSCFVLMPFKEPFETYYTVIIRPAIAAANLDVRRGDSLFTPTPIMGDVWKMIQDATVLVAELTGKNPNVFYELGLGHALGKPIVLISETMEDVPFDLQQLRVILYDKDDPGWGNKLKNAITTALQETVATPVEAVPPMFRKRVKSQAPEDSETSLRLLALERRVTALAARPPVTELDDRRHINWSEVYKHYMEMPAGRDLKAPRFKAREHAVAWVVAKIRAGAALSAVRSKLAAHLPDDEVEIVFNLAGQMT